MKQLKKISPIQIVRRVSQLLSFLLFPGLFTSTLDAMKGLMLALLDGNFTFNGYASDLLLLMATIPFTIFMGRFFCGFVCAFGSMGDLLWFISGKTIKSKFKISEQLDAKLKWIKYAILIVIVVGIWWLDLVTIDNSANPWTIFGMYSTMKGWQSIDYLFTIGGFLLLLIMVGSLFMERFFCRYFCPLGAMYALLSKLRIFRITKNRENCGSCRMCTNKCSMGIGLNQTDQVTSGECINCFQCVDACKRKNVKTNAAPVIASVGSVAAIAGIFYSNTLLTQAKTAEENAIAIAVPKSSGTYIDGTYTGTARGYRGETQVQVTVSNGNITKIEVLSYDDDDRYFVAAKSSVIPDIIVSQDTEVDSVSGATFSCEGIANAVADALEDAKNPDGTESELSDSTEDSTEDSAEDNAEDSTEDSTAKEEESDDSASSSLEEYSLEDGTYTGTGTGFRGETEVTVSVVDGEISDITVESYEDDEPYFNRAQDIIISEIIENQDVDVDAVSGATYSCNGIKEAVANAIGIAFVNPNSLNPGGHGGHGGHGRH